ncbi:MAG: tRNA 2-thiouridine(34) synthase MnmA [candidate division WOR-3 bacterium]|nr:tRNA 2-thiouridine(34) synthase MnmA [candidate division WOR-3 bacterium]MCX7947425.1 tRNA 2-thiouridine(34) synthase MnmA [candidate division WOR-3 bacterium]MDW8151177.1 tRNA 2-thiouridine(34) synthase MnmA [candidate division WOR-3 bacterium]
MNRVVLGLSGGVDSSVAIYLLKNMGYEVIGVNVILYDESKNPRTCCSIDALRLAYKVAKKFNIPFKFLNYSKAFKENIVRMFISEYLSGRVPNVCVFCNRDYKMGALFEYAKSINAKLATGHYARIGTFRGERVIARAKDKSKDQSYFLSYLTREIVNNLILPIGDYTKEEIRKMASDIGLINARRVDSMDICFVDSDYREFLIEKGNYIPKEGYFIDKYGNIVGKHKGYALYTIGQRRHLNIALGKRAYVVDVVPETNTVVLGFEEDAYTSFIKLVNLNFFVELESDFIAKVKIRNLHEPADARIKVFNNYVEIEFEKPQFSPARGQVGAIYIDDYLVGAGIIE